MRLLSSAIADALFRWGGGLVCYLLAPVYVAGSFSSPQILDLTLSMNNHSKNFSF